MFIFLDMRFFGIKQDRSVSVLLSVVRNSVVRNSVVLYSIRTGVIVFCCLLSVILTGQECKCSIVRNSNDRNVSVLLSVILMTGV